MLIGLTVTIVLAVHVQEPTGPPGLGETAPSARTAPRTEDGESIKDPQKKKHVAPKWPENAQRAGLHGTVTLECVISTEGRVSGIKVLKGFSTLAEAAEKAVRKWEYTPTMLRGKAVPVIMTVRVNFNLRAAPARNDALDSLTDSNPEIRWAAIQWLSRYRPVTGAQRAAVSRAMKDPEEFVRKAAKEALENFEVK